VEAGFPIEHEASGRLDLPPRRDAFVNLPDDFGRRFMVVVDTEESFDWSRPFDRAERSTDALASLPAVHARFRDRGVQPVYVIDHPVASDPRAARILRDFLDRDECVIGTHLHPWVNPPFDEDVNLRNSFAGNLPIELEQAKLRALTGLIEEAFGRRPIVYRAGRYGVGPATAALLREEGYRLDVSVRSFFDYSSEDGPDFSRIGPRPYWVGDKALLEVPFSSAYIGALRGAGPALYPAAGKVPYLRGVLSRTGLLARVSLTPEGVPVDEVIRAIDSMIEDDVRLFSFAFHSPSTEPGHTPYVRDQRDLDLFLEWWDRVFDRLDRRGITPATAGEILAAAEASTSQ
jgi:hypothetical protein